jgi:hypothetical protein
MKDRSHQWNALRKNLLRPGLLLLALMLSASSLMAADTPVKIVSVEPESALQNPNGRLWKRLHPLRFRVNLQNMTDQPQTGLLVSEAGLRRSPVRNAEGLKMR